MSAGEDQTAAATPETADSAELKPLADSISRLFSGKIKARQRAAVVKQMCLALWHKRTEPADAAGRVLNGLIPAIPIRTREKLHQAYGPDPEAVAKAIIHDASMLVGGLWATAAAVPAPPPVTHAAKVVLHSLIEIRLIGELYAIYDDPRTRDTAWVNTYLHAWAIGFPIAYGSASLVSARDIAAKIRFSSVDLVSDYSRVTRVVRGGRDGRDRVRRLGSRFQRRMRFDPQTWYRPERVTGRDLITGPAAKMLADAAFSALTARYGRTGQIANTAKRLILDREPGQPAAAEAATPVDQLDLAWSEYRQARRANEAHQESERFTAALEAQARDLQALGSRLGRPVIPAQAAPGSSTSDSAGSALEHAQLANLAIDNVELLGAQPRRLADWPVQGRNALGYLLTALVVALPAATGAVVLSHRFDSPWQKVAVIFGTSFGLPLLSYLIGLISVGRAFRPWLGGPVPRSPFIGLAINALVGVVAAVAMLILG